MPEGSTNDPDLGVTSQLSGASLGMRAALGWWVVAELMRRHPGRLHLQEESGHHGQCLSVGNLRTQSPGGWDSAYLFMPLGNNFVIHAHGPGGDLWMGGADALLAGNRRADVIFPIERVMGLSAPAVTPQTTQESIGQRVIAAFLQRNALERGNWWVSNGAPIDDESGTCVQEQLFRTLPTAAADAEVRSKESSNSAERRYWFLMPVLKENEVQLGFGISGELGPPALALDLVAGVLFTEHGRLPLLPEFNRMQRRLDLLVSTVMPSAL